MLERAVLSEYSHHQVVDSQMAREGPILATKAH